MGGNARSSVYGTRPLLNIEDLEETSNCPHEKNKDTKFD
jgi:hypothetical protein